MNGKNVILTADSAELTRAVVGEIFTPEFTTVEVGDGSMLLKTMRERRDEFSALMLGGLPTEEQAVELLGQMKAEGLLEGLPVFLMLQDGADNGAVSGLESGALDIIEKPLAPAVARQRVKNGIELYSRRTHSDLLHRLSVLLHGEKKNAAENEPTSHLTDRTLRLLELEREKYRLLSEMSSDITFTYDCIRKEAEFSEGYREVFGGDVRQSGSFGSIVSRLLPQEDIGLMRKTLLKAITKDHPFFKTEIRLRTFDGTVEWFELYIRGFFDPNDPDVCLTCLGKMTSIDELKQETRRWQMQARMDSLTGLYNRKGVRDLVEPLLNKSTVLGIMFVDVDYFKAINDSHGHLFGDRVLEQVAKVLSGHLRSTDIVGRIGGDEFIVAMKDLPSRDVLGHKAEELGILLRQMKLPDGQSYPVTCSIGLAVCPDDGIQYDQLLEKADQALYYVKNHGNDGWTFYQPDLLTGPIPSVLSEVDPAREN